MFINIERVAVIGAGLAGTIAALALARKGIQVDLFDRNQGIFMGSSAIPAHLYSGVQYFGDIPKQSIQQCMYDAISFARALPFLLECRPTVMAIAKEDVRRPKDLEEICKMNQKIYGEECLRDPKNEVFGPPSQFYKAYPRKELLEAQKDPKSEEDRWIAVFAHHTDFDSLQFPIFLIREYGIDMRRATGFIEQILDESENIQLRLSVDVKKVQLVRDGILLSAQTQKGSFEQKYHFIIDASGNNLGTFEAQLGIDNLRSVDIKITGLFKYSMEGEDLLPEIYILGGKGDPHRFSFMSHVSPIQQSMNGKEGLVAINVTTPDCTYIEGGKQRNQGKGAVAITPEACPLAYDVLKKNYSHFSRLKNMLEKISRRHAFLAKKMDPICGISGSVDLLGADFLKRDSTIDAHFDKRFISINITKVGAVVRIAEEICEKIGLCCKTEESPWMPNDIKAAFERTRIHYLKLGIAPSFSSEEIHYQKFRKMGKLEGDEITPSSSTP